MNAILARLDALPDRVDLDRFGLDESASCVLFTPRFRTSRHVVALLIPRGAREPRLVVKMPRLEGDGAGIAREALVLRELRGTCPDASPSVPQVVAYAGGDRPLLIETAFGGPLVTRATLRAAPTRCVDEVVKWLISLSSAPRDSSVPYERLIAEPLSRFADSFPEPAPEDELVARTLEIVEPLREASVPRVIEHGDLSHPNLILLPSGRVGVVDWELAEEDGFPLHDLSFFLAFSTFALRRCQRADEYLAAFHDAFFGRGGWARSRVRGYADALELDEEVLTSLFVACWARYTAQLVTRIGGGRPGLSEQDAAWVRDNRYYALWAHTLDHLEDLDWRRR
jgi:aminoglycoside phosphotransferase (APT) family kinase protein